jgi:hypothetical protein
LFECPANGFTSGRFDDGRTGSLAQLDGPLADEIPANAAAASLWCNATKILQRTTNAATSASLKNETALCKAVPPKRMEICPRPPKRSCSLVGLRGAFCHRLHLCCQSRQPQPSWRWLDPRLVSGVPARRRLDRVRSNQWDRWQQGSDPGGSGPGPRGKPYLCPEPTTGDHLTTLA